MLGTATWVRDSQGKRENFVPLEKRRHRVALPSGKRGLKQKYQEEENSRGKGRICHHYFGIFSLGCFTSVLVDLGCHDKIPESDWLISRNLFLTALQAGSLRSGCRHSWVRAIFQVSDFLSYHEVVYGARELAQVSLIRALILFMRTLL